MGGLGIAVLVGLAVLLSKKGPQGTVTVGPARIIKAPPKTTVRIGPAKITPAVKVKIGPAKIAPVHTAVPTSIHDTTAVAVQAAQKPGHPPIPNAEAARKVAQPVADHVRNNRKKYDHKRVATFQGFAGIKPDGLYGPQTAKALRAFGAKNVVS